jgi:HK97 family phage major capsid protein
MPTTRIVTASGEPMDFPKVASHAVATQVSGQGTTLAGTDPTFAKLTLTPVKHGELVKIASEVVTDSGIDIVGFIARDIGRALGRQVNAVEMAVLVASAFAGTGGTVATGGSLVTPDYDDLVNLQYSIVDAYRNGNAGWLMKDSTAGTLRKLRDGAGGTEGAPLWQPSTQTGIAGQVQPDTLLGFPVFTDPAVAAQGSNARVVFFGDWSAYYLRLVGDPIIERNDSVGFATDEVYFRGKWRADSGAQDTTAINLLKMSVS